MKKLQIAFSTALIFISSMLIASSSNHHMRFRGQSTCHLHHKMMFQGPKKEKQHERFEQRLKEFSTRLSLTSDQQNKVREIMKQSRVEAKSIAEANKNKEDRRPKMMQLALKTDAQIEALLDAKQLEIYKQIKVERREKRKENMKEQKEMRMEMDDAGIL